MSAVEKSKVLKRNISKLSEEEKEGLLAKSENCGAVCGQYRTATKWTKAIKEFSYIRYADDFLIGVIGRKADAEQVKQDVGRFIRENLHLEMSEEKSLITHGHDFASSGV